MDATTAQLNVSLTFLAYATGVIIIIVGGMLTKVLYDMSKLTRNVDDTVTIAKTELEPTLKNINKSVEIVSGVIVKTDESLKKAQSILKDLKSAKYDLEMYVLELDKVLNELQIQTTHLELDQKELEQSIEETKQQLADAILSFFDDQSLFEKCSKNATLLVQQRFNAQRVADSVMEIYAKCVS